MAASKPFRVVVITAPERLDQDWINRLAGEADVERLERVGVLAAGIELVQQARPDVVIIDRDLDQTEASVRQIFTSVPGSPCIALSAQADMAVLRRLVAAGARDVLGKPVQYSELIHSVRGVLATEADRRSRALVPLNGESDFRGRGKLAVVMSPKGGVGTTTIATNLAVGLRQIGSGRVVLADFGLQFGDIGVHLNLWSKHTMQDLLGHIEDLDDAMLGQVLQPHSTGIQVLLAPNEPGVAGDVTREQLEAILDHLLERNSYVVADTWSFLDEVAETLLRRADEVLIVTTPEVPALKNAKHFLEFLRGQDLAHGRITLVLNRFPSVDGISLQDVQQHLRHPVGANIPSEGQLVTHSVNRGIPIVVSHPQSWAAQSMLKLAAYVAGDKVGTITLTPDNKGGRGKEREQAARSDRAGRGLLRFTRREA